MTSTTLAPVADASQAGQGANSAYRTDDRVKARVLAGVRERFLLESPDVPIIDALFEDLESILGQDADLEAARVSELTPRLHAVFRRVMYVARQHPHSGIRPATVEAYRSLLVERFPPVFLPALAHLRRLAMAVSDLLDELLEDMP
ncbi:DUF6415 family natural product biosynthesis protein [Streptomyces sp. NPDC101151]|uniref:DUF6415 family natural product biosynthesis protein n=1 Tax=Streptomyces sp. NPDC101151 TaxID=3366115 RepID=UPI0038049FE2